MKTRDEVNLGEPNIVPLPSAPEATHNSETTQKLYDFMIHEGLAEKIGVKEASDLEREPSVLAQDRQQLIELRPNIHFATFPHPDSGIHTTLEEPLLILDLDDVYKALTSLEPSERAAMTLHIFSQLRNNSLAAQLKQAPDDVTLYRWAQETDSNYGGGAQTLPYADFANYPNEPVSWWRVPVEGHPYDVNQWRGSDKTLFVKPISELCNEGILVVDVIDPDSVVFLEVTNTQEQPMAVPESAPDPRREKLLALLEETNPKGAAIFRFMEYLDRLEKTYVSSGNSELHITWQGGRKTSEILEKVLEVGDPRGILPIPTRDRFEGFSWSYQEPTSDTGTGRFAGRGSPDIRIVLNYDGSLLLRANQGSFKGMEKELAEAFDQEPYPIIARDHPTTDSRTGHTGPYYANKAYRESHPQPLV